MNTIVLLGFGNVGFHLATALNKLNKNTVIQIYGRSNISLNSELDHIPVTTDLSRIKDADLYIIAIPDDSIAVLSESLPLKNKLVVHTSGSVSMDSLSEKNRKGVFYPLQTFSKNRDVNFKKIPICIEAEDAKDLKFLMNMGKGLSEKVVVVNSEERSKLHLAAVFVNNFVNHLYAVSDDFLGENNLPFELLHPLIEETASKIKTLTPSQVQTGPAKRRDQKTIEKHVHLLEEDSNIELYKLFTESISKKYRN